MITPSGLYNQCSRIPTAKRKCPRQKFGIFTQEQMEFAAPPGQGAEHAKRKRIHAAGCGNSREKLMLQGPEKNQQAQDRSQQNYRHQQGEEAADRDVANDQRRAQIKPFLYCQ